ncbi:hypothetical protein [Salipiger sp.]|uniref:hypothetical protein n=1 Tax=Salipiger sp. TaxID=2078585 RepID=UPI003A977D8F
MRTGLRAGRFGARDPMAEVSGREPMEYLRVFVRIRLKVDFIRGMFVTPCIRVFGLMQFYPGEVGAGFSLLICGAMTAFTWINGTSLRMHYRVARVMLRE